MSEVVDLARARRIRDAAEADATGQLRSPREVLQELIDLIDAGEAPDFDRMLVILTAKDEETCRTGFFYFISGATELECIGMCGQGLREFTGAPE